MARKMTQEARLAANIRAYADRELARIVDLTQVAARCGGWDRWLNDVDALWDTACRGTPDDARALDDDSLRHLLDFAVIGLADYFESCRRNAGLD